MFPFHAGRFQLNASVLVNLPLGPPLTWTETAAPAAINATNLASPQTFSAVAIGTASSDRFVVVCFQNIKAGGAGAGGDLASVTIGGLSATKVCGTPSSNQRVTEIWYANVTTGTTANIVMTFTTGFIDGIHCAVGILTGSTSTHVSSTQVSAGYPAANNNTNIAAVTVVTGGVAVFSAIADGNAATTAWTNATKDSPPGDVGYIANSGVTGTMAHATASATVTETVSGSGGVSGWIAASFTP